MRQAPHYAVLRCDVTRCDTTYHCINTHTSVSEELSTSPGTCVTVLRDRQHALDHRYGRWDLPRPSYFNLSRAHLPTFTLHSHPSDSGQTAD